MASAENTRYGSDLIVDLLMESGIEHVAFNPGASFRGIHDSLVHTPNAPEISLCMHEMVAVSMAQGYSKAAGKPMAAMLHNVVGLQNASMAIYNAWCDRAPMLLIGGTGPKSKARRRPWIDWIHTASVQANIVRDFLVWDDEPHDVYSIEESMARARSAATSAPGGPVYLCYDFDLQEDPLPADFVAGGIGRFPVPSDPAPSVADTAWLVDVLRRAVRPVVLAGYAGETPEAFGDLVALAEALGAPVIDTGVRHAFPTTHPLAGMHVEGLLGEADVVLALDVEDIHTPLRERRGDRGLTLLNVSLSSLKLRSWAHDYQEMVPGDRHVTASSSAAVSAILSRLRAEPLDVDLVARRTSEIGERVRAARARWWASGAQATADGSVPLERLQVELARALDGTDYVLGGGTNSHLEHRYLALDRPRQYAGWGAGGGLGYGVSGALGVALAQQPGTITVDVQNDGDLLFLPSALWTAAHKSLPVLIVVNNNRQYGNTVGHSIEIGRARGHREDRRYVGAGLSDPPVDLAGMARSFGIWGSGPISDPDVLAEQLSEAVAVVRSGRPALLDVLTPGL
ncbi:thiamine pyrophosphate-binding protein [Rhodococcus sp. IEGM 1381]|uniref:thiamine pyrophosphate-binding protein n=1 Tax=Rhodococcus sp. IEGM 1381 TaxID=3047085 RepID=UPI0024B7FD87|nr:thiamine pyrophosphate-dependent enzyme [Rhodococcus sp. IEGM 1381]MDI9897375.1 thiamine pyrophosphate-binding protein [Rhodococcus sp. IEGM 1381]MDI9897426.1 thiamine pyrophosphate-binding protein [Rhodococcus sp. IEGM 1381]